jgi:hypothetical protein
MQIRLLLMLFFVVCASSVALVKPLPSRADNNGDLVPTPPDPTNADPLLPPLPVVHAAPVRRPASVKHLHILLAAKVVDYAKKLVGVPYVYGGSTPSGFDCSGFTSYVFRHFGLSISRTSYSQFGNGIRVARNALKPGDLVFFHGLGHVGLYLGEGRFIHSPRPGSSVRVESLSGWYSSRFDGARRVIRGDA